MAQPIPVLFPDPYWNCLHHDVTFTHTIFTDPLYEANMSNMLAMTQCLVIERYNRIYFFDQPERVENSRFCVLRTAVGTALPVDLPSLASFLCCDPSLITQATPNVPTARAKRACSSTLKTKEQQQKQQQHSGQAPTARARCWTSSALSCRTHESA